MSDNDRLRKLVLERHQLLCRIQDIDAEIATEVSGGSSQPLLHRIIVTALIDGDKKIGDVVRFILETGYRSSEKNRDIAAAVATALSQLKIINAVEMKADRIYTLVEEDISCIMDRIRERFRTINNKSNAVVEVPPTSPTTPTPPTPDAALAKEGTRRRGRPKGSRNRCK